MSTSEGSPPIRPIGRIKLGEIFQCEGLAYEFTCCHCLYDFSQFAEFTSHVQEYLQEILMFQQQNDVDSDSGSEHTVKIVEDFSDEEMELVNKTHTIFDDVVVVIDDDDNEENNDIGQKNYDESSVHDDNINDNDNSNSVYNDDEYDDTHSNQFGNDILIEEDTNETNVDESSTADDSNSYKCPLCKSCYSTIEFLQMHLSNFHSKTSIFRYLSNVPTMEQQDTFNTDKSVVGSIVIEDSPEAAEYSKYLFGIHFEKNASGLRKCPKCSYASDRLFSVRNHLFTHLKRKIFTCLSCKRKFHKLSMCRQHIRQMHL